MTAYKFEYNGAEYVLEFDRASVEVAERTLGIDMKTVEEPKVSTMEDMFHAALLKHHRKIKRPTVRMLYDLQSDKVGLHQDLCEMYIETAGGVLVEPEEGEAISRTKC